MSRHWFVKKCRTTMLISLLAILGCTNTITHGAETDLNPVTIKEWKVPWEQTRPRDPYVDQHNRVWFVGQTGDYIAVLDFEAGMFEQYPLDAGTGPHNLIVDKQGFVWYAGNRAAHIGKLNPMTGHITKYAMPNSSAGDPHTLVFGKPNEIWFTVQQGNYVGKLAMDTGSILLTPLLTQNARPYGIVVGSTHRPWFTEFGTNKLGTIDSTTKSVKEISLPRTEARPRRLALTSDNAVWYVDYAGGYLGRFIPTTRKVKEWRAPGGEDARPYGMTVDDKDRVWFVETGLHPNRLVGFDTNDKNVISITNIESGGGTVRHMFYHQPTQTIWFGTDANTIGRVTLP
jgi:virginiamycin B lyase